MNNKKKEEQILFLGNQKLQTNNDKVNFEYKDIDGELFYKISNYDKMPPFFMSIVSGSDHWMFISSNGGLTAGRKNPDNALFPYYTDDIIHTSHETTGSKTLLRVNSNGKTFYWEPFSDYYKNIYRITRNIYKNIPGNKIIFEEVNHDLDLIFNYYWMNSEQFGFIKQSCLIYEGVNNIEINFLDGIQNILPYGIDQKFQNEFSTLADGYKKNELHLKYGIGIYSLSSIPSDKAEPSESLKATFVWSTGIEVNKYLLSSTQLNAFRNGEDIINEKDIKAKKGAYFINASILLKSNEMKSWFIVADINQDQCSLAELENLKDRNNNISEIIKHDIIKGTENLTKIVASADGLQFCNDNLITSRHFSNVLFNTMRGGIFDDSYHINLSDFITFIRNANKQVYETYKEKLQNLSNKLLRNELEQFILQISDNKLTKLFYEYLPLTFSRRHGDPSRPWNIFSIDIKNYKNEKILNYQGNWRDLFQNWEALAFSFPGYLDSMIAKFLNASTADGYNPYRIARDGFDWEIPEPDMPWSNIGYWGDHQIIYLLKLLELYGKFDESGLLQKISNNIYSYANVPYRIKSYQEMLNDPHDTIEFDDDLNNKIIENEKIVGSDARLLKNKKNDLILVNLAEKLIVTLLSKLSNFIPGGGIWMNTQRPEWNDANNALVGNGISMVTLYYLRRYVTFCINLFSKVELNSASFSEEVALLFKELNNVLYSNIDLLKSGINNKNRKNILDGLAASGEKYRNQIYLYGFSSIKEDIKTGEIIEFLNTANNFIEYTIKINRREDGLYHSYNLMSLVNKDEIKIINLYEMLEGQVAVLSSGFISTKESINLIKALKESSLYRKDQNSYILYPNRQLPLFVEKNNIPKSDFKSSKLLQLLVKIGNIDIVSIDEKGKTHFNGEIRNNKILKSKLTKLTGKEVKSLVNEETDLILNIYESIFNHKSFTGRSGTFYKYEGLGSIYWHMVSKLVLAVQETYFNAERNDGSEAELNKLRQYYYDIKEGIGVHKSPKDYGAFPTDPYSHTPINSGVQQPGMTGQVKEDIISRYGELGIVISNETISFNPTLLNKAEFLKNDGVFQYYDIKGNACKLNIAASSLVFTYCQIPIIYKLANTNRIKVFKNEDKPLDIAGLSLGKELSKLIFNRDEIINRIEVSVNFD